MISSTSNNTVRSSSKLLQKTFPPKLNTPLGVSLLVKLQALASKFTKYNTLLWVSFHVFEIVQMASNCACTTNVQKKCAQINIQGSIHKIIQRR